MIGPLNILILAGRRAGILDPLAERAGVSHKCLVPVAGVPMIERTLRIAAETFPHAQLFISIEDRAIVSGLALVAALVGEGRLTLLISGIGLVESVIEAGRQSGFPILITTADNVLMLPRALRRLADAAATGDADAYATFTSREDIFLAHPEGEIRFFHFRDGAYSNCNMFWLANPKAMKTLEFFRDGGQFAKRPERILKAFGLWSLILYRLRIATVEGIAAILSRRYGIRMRILVMPEGQLAIDVDDERTKRVAEEILARTAGAANNAPP